jgi:signal transduction histidine kinase
MIPDLRAVPLFAELSDEDLERLAARSDLVALNAGEQLFAEGDPGHRAFVITEGALEIIKRTGEREVLLAVREPGEVIGEMALLQDSPRTATVRARTDAVLVSIPKSEIDVLLDTSVEAVRALFRVLLDRWLSTQALLRQSERMAQLGTLTAGLAHELNNPAAAVARAAGQLRTCVEELVEAERALAAAAGPEMSAIEAVRSELRTAAPLGNLDALARGDLEQAMEDRLAEAGVPDGWRLAPALVEAGLADQVDGILEAAGQHASELLEAIHAEHNVASLLHEVEEGTRRLSSIVGALKSYSYLDQAPVQQVDLKAGIEDTLLILKAKLAGIEVRLQFDPDLPHIEGYGSELNQVWTNLLDNAADAIHETEGSDGLIVVRGLVDDDVVVIEVEDNGAGIPPEALNRVFDSFFTTKPPGSGTGLGLNISYAIVVHRHRGEMSVESEPGRTVFRVELPRVATS